MRPNIPLITLVTCEPVFIRFNCILVGNTNSDMVRKMDSCQYLHALGVDTGYWHQHQHEQMNAQCSGSEKNVDLAENRIMKRSKPHCESHK